MRPLSTCMAIALGLGLLSCGNSTTEEKLVLTGSSTVAPLVSEIGKRFEEDRANVRVDVQTGGSSRGITDARDGIADLGMASRSLTSEESDLQTFTIAFDGIGIVLHQDNLISSLTKSQILEIYTGDIDNWQEVGGNNAEITVINKAEGRGTLEVFLDYLQIENSAIRADSIVGDNQQGIKTVAGNPNAIGYVSIGAAQESIDAGVPVRLAAIDGIEATLENVQAERYPLYRPLNLVSKDTPEGLTKTFIEFARSPEVRDIIEEQNFVPFSP